jgi:hypothetical protein
MDGVHRFRSGGKSGRLAPDWMDGLLRIQWTACSGFTGRFRPEYAVTRDRSTGYLEGVTQGAPQAIQVADRFHLQKNLREMVEKGLTRH